MPHDMFGDVVCSHARNRSTGGRPSLMLASIGAHAVALAIAVAASILAPDILPAPAVAQAAPFVVTVLMPVEVSVENWKQRPKPSPGGDRHRPQPAHDPLVKFEKPGPTPPVTAPFGIGLEKPDVAGGEAGTGQGNVRDVPIEQGLVNGHTHFGAAAALPRPPSPQPVRLHSGMQAPRKIVDVAPDYPGIARHARVQGVVILEAVIDEAGAVSSARVLRSIAMLDEAALTAVRQWRFEPARLNGSAVPIVMTVTVSFQLD